MDVNWEQITAAAAVGAGMVYAWQRSKPDKEIAQAQTEAISVDTLRDVILELRAELERVRSRLAHAEGLIEQLTGERLPDNILGF